MIKVDWKEFVRDHFNMFGIHYIRNSWQNPGHHWAIYNPNLEHKPHAIQFIIARALGKWA